MPDSARVATTICFTYIESHTKNRLVSNEKQNLELNPKTNKYLLSFNKTLLLEII